MATTPLTDEITRNDYTATAGQTSFPYTFWVRDEDDLLVYVNGTLKTKTTDYTVSAVQSVTGANVVFTSGLALNDTVAIVYEPSIERESGYTTGGSFRANSFNLDITYGLSLAQYLKTELGRTVKVDNTESGSAPTISGSLTAGELVQVNNGGTSIVSSGLDGDDISALSLISTDISTVASISANVTTVAGDSADISTVATNIANVNTTAGNVTNINTVASNSSNVTLVATDITNVNTVATNITGVNSFAERYRVVSSDPISDNDEGDLIYNDTDNLLKYYNGASFVSLSSGLVNVVEDTTPQLGGDLDLNGNSLTSPDGTDSVSIPDGSVDISTNSSSRVDITDSGLRLGGSGARVATILDEDTLSSNSDTALATQQSIKAYVDNNSSSTILQAKSAYSTTGKTASGTIPNDDTSPQSSEGAEAITLAFTPQSATSQLYIWYGGSIDLTGSNNGGFALFVDSGSTCVDASPMYGVAASYAMPNLKLYKVASGSTTARTYKMRFGGDGAGVDIGGSTAKWGGNQGYGITILEVDE
jgi:hypothetical protein